MTNFENNLNIVRLNPVNRRETRNVQIHSEHVNFSPALKNALFNMPMYVPYFGCKACYMPIVYFCEIFSEISNIYDNELIVAYVVPLLKYSLMMHTTCIEPSLVYWETSVRCGNEKCGAILSICELSNYNRQIDEYIYEGPSQFCAMLDPESVVLFQREQNF